MISFRLTSEEYDKCRDLCFSQGIRSVSEMARTAIHLLLRQPTQVPQEALEARVAELEGRLRILALELKKVTQSREVTPTAVPPRVLVSATSK